MISDDLMVGNRINLMRMLLTFAHLREGERTLFISQMNEFLLASPKLRRRIVERWQDAADGNKDGAVR